MLRVVGAEVGSKSFVQMVFEEEDATVPKNCVCSYLLASLAFGRMSCSAAGAHMYDLTIFGAGQKLKRLVFGWIART